MAKKESEEVTIKEWQILQLQYSAQGFRRAFYIIYNSMIGKEGSENWMQIGDSLSVLVTNGCFAVELYFKFLTVLSNFDKEKCSGKFYKGHDLAELYELLPKTTTYKEDLNNLYQHTKYKRNMLTLKEFLESIRLYFESWRYSFSGSKLRLFLNPLSDLLNILEEYSESKAKPIIPNIKDLEFKNYKDQQIIIDGDFNSIEMKIFSSEKNLFIGYSNKNKSR